MFQCIFVIIVMAILVFLGVYALGNPIDLLINPESDQQEIDAAMQRLGLDRPLHEQFYFYISNAIKGDLGNSFVHGEPAMKVIWERLPATMELAVFAMLIAIVIGIPFGMIAGLRPDAIFSKIIMGGSILGFSMPLFWIGLLLIMLFSVMLGWLPANGRGDVVLIFGIPLSFITWDGFVHLLLPAVSLSLFRAALIIRLARSGTREVLLMDYIKFARAKGLKHQRILFVHVLKNILIPIVTVVGMEFANFIAFAVVTETIFSWPGIGKLLIDSINLLDRPLIVAYLLMTVTMIVVINFIVDIVYSLLDPRIRLGEKAK
jgi:peptide/nickel transport system permease protein